MLRPRYVLAMLAAVVLVALCVLQTPQSCQYMDECIIDARPQGFVADASAQTSIDVNDSEAEEHAISTLGAASSKKPRVVESEPIPLDSLSFDL